MVQKLNQAYFNMIFERELWQRATRILLRRGGLKPKVKQFCLKNVSIWQRGKKVVQLARVSQAEV